MKVTMLGPAEIRALADRLDVNPTKKLGQNFVHDANTVRRIVSIAGVQPNESVLEVGPGLGSLTLGLLDAGARVVAVEIDARLGAELPATVARRAPDVAIGGQASGGQASGGQASAALSSDGPSGGPSLDVVIADAMRVTELPLAPAVLVANLPYNISVPVLLHLLATFPSIERGLVMVQAEVGHRIAAEPGSKVYGSPSVKAAWYGSWRTAGAVNRQVFWPVPNVDSVLVGFDRHEEAPGTEAERRATFAIVDAAFQQRRKMLRQALVPLLGADSGAVLERAGIDPTLRGEQLAVGDYLALARASSVEA